MKKPILFLILLVYALACREESDQLDIDLRFAINTAQGSKGLSSFILPRNGEFNRIPQDPKNPLTSEKIELGKMLFHETAFGTIGAFPDLKKSYSCASCHNARAGFQSGRMQGLGDGGVGFGTHGEGRRPEQLIEISRIDAQPLRTPSLLNVAYQENMMWNGELGAYGKNEDLSFQWPNEGTLRYNKLGYEGVETAAISGLELHRQLINDKTVASNGYQSLFDAAFPDIRISDRYSNKTAGLALAAYLRSLIPDRAPFQDWLRGNSEALSESQKQGAILFFSKAKCLSCHNGGGLAKTEFHAIGLNDFDADRVINTNQHETAFLGRATVTKNQKEHYQFKVPQLYNLKDAHFFGHGASFTSIGELIRYKNKAISENPNVPVRCLSSFFTALDLTEVELTQLTDFVENALYDPDLERYEPKRVMSDACFPNNDWMSRQDLGCN